MYSFSIGRAVLSATALAVLAAALVALVAMATSGSPAKAQATGGPVVLMGIDAEDCGPGGHGPIGVYEDVVQTILGNVSNGGSGILVIGGGKTPGFGPTAFWDAISADTGIPVAYVNGAAAIPGQAFSDFALLAVVSAVGETCDGLTQAENDALAGRLADITTFINGGGGLLGFSQAGLTNPYDYIGGLGSFAVNINLSYEAILPTAEGATLGITDALDLCCWHDVYTTFPSYFDVLAYDDDGASPTFGQAAAVGGQQVVILPEGPFGDPTCSDDLDNDADTLVDDADPDCAPAETPTPEPTPTPTPTAAAPAALPDTGGEPGGGSGWWLAAMIGVALLAGSGASWLAYERRRGR
jgi:hypothetical protein